MLSYDMQGLWREMPLAFLDLESTGLSTDSDRITEVGIVTYVDGRVVDRWGSLVNPGMPIPEVSSNITHITDELVADEPPFRDVVWEVYRRLRDKVAVAYNGISFDLPLLTAEMARCGLTPPEQPVLDPMMWVFKKMPSRSGWPFGLVKAAERLGVEQPEAHRAVADCEAMAQVTFRLAEHVPPQLGDLMKRQQKWYDEFMVLKAERDARKAAKNVEEEPEDEGQGGLF
jgi:DNA polymerase III subunit epsilon